MDHPVADIGDPAASAAENDGEVQQASHDAESPGVAGGRLPEGRGLSPGFRRSGFSGREPERLPDFGPGKTRQDRGGRPQEEEKMELEQVIWKEMVGSGWVTII